MVYVDELIEWRPGKPSCHMLADTLEELHAMADAIGMRRAWYQPKSTPHYDLSPSKRRAAISRGAVPTTRKEIARLIEAYRQPQ